MTVLQEQSVSAIQNRADEKIQAFQELVATRNEVEKYLTDDFDPDTELEAARKERLLNR